MKQNERLGSSPVYGRAHESSTHPQTLEDSQQAQPRQPIKRKKQIRRRLLTSGPCEENAVDLAVARREIVTALRLHRACMNQNSDNHPRAPHQAHSASSSRATQPQHKQNSNSRKNSELYDFSTSPNFSNNLNNLSYQPFPCQPPQTSCPWPMCVSAPPPIPEIFELPNRTLGLNLNLQDFDNLDTTVLQNIYIPEQCYTSTSPSTSNLHPLQPSNRTLCLNLNLQDFVGLDTTIIQNNYIPERCYTPTSPSTSNLLPLQPSNQTLGLNLDLQDFDGLDTTVLQNNYSPDGCYTSTFPSTSNSLPQPSNRTLGLNLNLQNNFVQERCYISTSASTSNPLPLPVSREETPSVGLLQASLVADPGVEGDLGLHHAVDEEEMAEIRSLGEKHQIDWDDTINMVTSAWWSDFLKNKENDTNRFGTEFPPWLNTNDNCSKHLDEPSDYFQDPTLPQMYIGENEGMDGEWLG